MRVTEGIFVVVVAWKTPLWLIIMEFEMLGVLLPRVSMCSTCVFVSVFLFVVSLVHL